MCSIKQLTFHFAVKIDTVSGAKLNHVYNRDLQYATHRKTVEEYFGIGT